MNVFESIMTGLQEAVDYENGKLCARTEKITIEPLPELSPEEIRQVRNKAGLTQSVFAAVIGVSVKTVEAWEAGTNHPIGPAKRMISMIQADPEFIEKYHLVSYSIKFSVYFSESLPCFSGLLKKYQTS